MIYSILTIVFVQTLVDLTTVAANSKYPLLCNRFLWHPFRPRQPLRTTLLDPVAEQKQIRPVKLEFYLRQPPRHDSAHFRGSKEKCKSVASRQKNSDRVTPGECEDPVPDFSGGGFQRVPPDRLRFQGRTASGKLDRRKSQPRSGNAMFWLLHREREEQRTGLFAVFVHPTRLDVKVRQRKLFE